MSAKKCSALIIDDRSTFFGDDGRGNMTGSYDVAELIATMSRPRYHIAPEPFTLVSSGENETVKMRSQVCPINILQESHSGRFLACLNVMPPSKAKSLGKSFKFIHAVGIVPLAHMDASDREAAMEKGSAADYPYTDASYDIDSESKKYYGEGQRQQ
jgi:hypothetical protein